MIIQLLLITLTNLLVDAAGLTVTSAQDCHNAFYRKADNSIIMGCNFDSSSGASGPPYVKIIKVSVSTFLNSVIYSFANTVNGDYFANRIALSQAGDVYFAGTVSRQLPNQTFVWAASQDVTVGKVFLNNTLAWQVQLGSTSTDDAYGIAYSEDQGQVVVTGRTQGSFMGKSNLGSDDMFVVAFSSDGVLGMVSTGATASADYGYAVALTSTTIYVAGLLGGVQAGLFMFLYNGTSLGTRSLTGQGTFRSAESYGNMIYVAGAFLGTLDGTTTSALSPFMTRYFTNGTREAKSFIYATALSAYCNDLEFDDSNQRVFIPTSPSLLFMIDLVTFNYTTLTNPIYNGYSGAYFQASQKILVTGLQLNGAQAYTTINAPVATVTSTTTTTTAKTVTFLSSSVASAVPVSSTTVPISTSVFSSTPTTQPTTVSLTASRQQPGSASVTSSILSTGLGGQLPTIVPGQTTLTTDAGLQLPSFVPGQTAVSVYSQTLVNSQSATSSVASTSAVTSQPGNAVSQVVTVSQPVGTSLGVSSVGGSSSQHTADIAQSYVYSAGLVATSLVTVVLVVPTISSSFVMVLISSSADLHNGNSEQSANSTPIVGAAVGGVLAVLVVAVAVLCYYRMRQTKTRTTTQQTDYSTAMSQGQTTMMLEKTIPLDNDAV